MSDANHHELAIVGLGRMGGGLAAQALDRGMRVAGVTLGPMPAPLVRAGIVDAGGVPGLRDLLSPPRKVLLYVPAGPVVDTLLDELAAVLEPGDVIADGGNSYWGDSIRRHARLQQQGLHLVDVGTSGGVEGARTGACFMAGGEDEPVTALEPLLRALATPGGYVHAGPPGAGHFVKLVHNGIEFGMLQAIAEGVDLLEHYKDRLAITDVLACWRHGSVIRSWLIDLMEQAYREHGGLSDVPPFVEDTGEVNWLIADALQMERPVPVIAQAVMQLFASRDAERQWARAIAMMRHGFGGHPFGEDEHIKAERHEGRVGESWRP